MAEISPWTILVFWQLIGLAVFVLFFFLTKDYIWYVRGLLLTLIPLVFIPFIAFGAHSAVVVMPIIWLAFGKPSILIYYGLAWGVLFLLYMSCTKSARTKNF
ncbi:hypothetical protein QSV34_02140 [Porticoccus sp. W117]|uniref:hypothetical protein n=1 Tax=Porticoccus sp. W117 TaxID=3054777 RepID=UPI0025932461|nr:hypothetical protein [Porticoccus sp. W117]MDM3870149.1 hypothetical protein [Porticoccus sp. W117]